MTQASEQSRAAAFEFARKLRDRDFRKFLTRHGYVDGQDIIIALPDEPVGDVFRRMFNQAKPPSIIALRSPAAIHGFAFMTATPGVRPGAEDVSIGSGATIGMLYDTLTAQTGQYTIPQSWVQVRTLTHA